MNKRDSIPKAVFNRLLKFQRIMMLMRNLQKNRIVIVLFTFVFLGSSYGCAYAQSQSSGGSGIDYDKYYKPSEEKRWYIAPDEGPVVGTQNAKYLGPKDLLPGAFRMLASVTSVQKHSFELLHKDCAWGKFTYRIIPVGKIAFDTAGSTIPDQRKNINSRSINIEDVPGVQTNLRLSGTIRKVLEDNQSFLVDLNFADAQPVTCRMDLVKSTDVKRSPEVRGYRYGPHWKHAFDIYYPEEKTDQPLPAIVKIHGGGWSALDKAARGEEAKWYNNHGLAYISVNYRYVRMHETHPSVEPPVAASLLDAARAVQTIRYKAEELGIDPRRLGFTGGSAGGATSSWLALHDDLAEPDADDPVARMSTKPTCAVPVQAQTSIDPRLMKKWIPGITYGAHAFFDRSLLPQEGQKEFQYFLKKREKILPWIEDFSAYRHASPDDPPMLLNYLGRKNVIPAEDDGHATHHPQFGLKLHEKLKELGVESHFICEDEVRSDEYTNWKGVRMFFVDKLKAKE